MWYSGFGMIHWAVRWKMVSCSTSGAMAGPIWKPLAPAPTRANLVPPMSRSSGQRAEWNEGPSKVSMPGISGIRGMLSEPTALMTNRASSTSSAPLSLRTCTRHVDRSSSQATSVTAVPNRQCGLSPNLSTIVAK